ncbi:hypothetical protein TWF506_009388 [Arthrobotrys conoides]|uniref:Alpha/beta hydrolase fold-3 domain-containing protein n=1 Tax=Arthrobotrys conoides TaxID=74498 RepID=A0AAN8NIE9_9PEZI
MLQTVARMRFPRHFLPAASRLVSHRFRESHPQLQYFSLRNVAAQTAQLHTRAPQLDTDEDLQDVYDQEYIKFYRKNIATKAAYNPFDDIALYEQYPCETDYQQETGYADVSCRDYTLPRKAAGSILLRVYNSLNRTSRSPVILYFPSRGTNPLPTTYEHHVISELTKLTNSTTISVGYRVSPPFPLSLHDALAAVDWARSLLPTVSLETYCQNGYDGRLMAVLGTGIGGSIAASIGATEGRESGIIAIGAWLPIVDWAFDPLPGIPESHLSTIPRSPSLLEKYSQADAEAIDPDLLSTYSQLADNPFLSSETLKTIRSHYLATPEDFTDPFVSPLYRFSSSGVNIWTNLISRVQSELLADPENPPAWVKSLPSTILKRGPRRLVPYPPLDLLWKLTVPMMRIVSAEGDILHQQISEYVHAARVSLFPSKLKTIEDMAKEEAKELGRTHNNDLLTEKPIYWNSSQDKVGKAEAEQDLRKRSWDEITEVKAKNSDGPGYTKAAEIYIQHEIIPKAGHCLITAAGEISSSIMEVKKMAEWINLVFESEPKQASRWKLQQENAKLKRTSKL